MEFRPVLCNAMRCAALHCIAYQPLFFLSPGPLTEARGGTPLLRDAESVKNTAPRSGEKQNCTYGSCQHSHVEEDPRSRQSCPEAGAERSRDAAGFRHSRILCACPHVVECLTPGRHAGGTQAAHGSGVPNRARRSTPWQGPQRGSTVLYARDCGRVPPSQQQWRLS